LIDAGNNLQKLYSGRVANPLADKIGGVRINALSLLENEGLLVKSEHCNNRPVHLELPSLPYQKMNPPRIIIFQGSSSFCKRVTPSD
jgi:hypothetical protein